MNKKYQSIAYITSGFFLSIIFWLITDWYDVKINPIQLNDFIGWGIWFLLSAPLIFLGIYKLTDKKIPSILFTVLILFILAIIDIFLVLNFHFWIGGTK